MGKVIADLASSATSATFNVENATSSVDYVISGTDGSANQILKTDGSGNLSWTDDSVGNTIKVAYLVDEKADTTAGGTFTSGAWRHRDLNTEYYDTIGVTLSSNEFTLPAGTFYIDWSCPAVRVVGHQSRLYNVTDTAVVKYGKSSRSTEIGSEGNQTLSSGSATVTISSGTETFKIEHRCSTTASTYGFGDNVDFGGVELFTAVKVMQIA